MITKQQTNLHNNGWFSFFAYSTVFCNECFHELKCTIGIIYIYVNEYARHSHGVGNY